MGFVNINGHSLNSEHIGEVRVDSKNLEVSYVFMGGRTEKIVYDNQADFDDALKEVSSTVEPQLYYITAADLNNLPKTGPMGTSAYCVDTQQLFMLNTKTDMWVEQ